MHLTIRTIAIAASACLLFASTGATPALQTADDAFAAYDVNVDSALGTAPMPEGGAFAPQPEFPGRQTPDEQHMQTQTLRTEQNLTSFLSLNIAPPTNASTVPQHPHLVDLVRREGDFCYSMMLLEELGNLSVLIRMPVPQHAPNTMGVCLLSDFPTTAASLGAARVVVNLNARVDVGEIERLSIFSISRDGLKIAYTILYQQGHVAVEVQDVASNEAGTLLTAQGCESLAWTPDSKSLFYIQRDSDAKCSSVAMYSPGCLHDKGRRHFHVAESLLILHSTKSYVFLEQRASNSSSLFVFAKGCGEGVWKQVYQVTVLVQFKIGEIAGGIFITAYKSSLAIQARFVAPKAMRDLLTNNRMTLISSALQIVLIPPGEALMHVSASDKCIVRWERYGIKNRLAVQKLEGPSCSKRLSPPRYIDINVPVDYQAMVDYSLADGNYAVLTYATLLKPVNVWSLNSETYTMVLERQETFSSFDVAPYAEIVRFVPTSSGRQMLVTFYYRKNKVQLNGSSPLLLSTNDWALFYTNPNLRSKLFTYMEQGLIVALAHTRAKRDAPSRMKEDLVEKEKEVVEDMKTIVHYIVINEYTAHKHLTLLGTAESSTSVAALINREPRICKSAVLLQSEVDSVAILNMSSHFPDADQPTPENIAAARQFSPVDNIPRHHQPYFPDVLILETRSLNILQSSIVVRYHTQVTAATKSLVLLYAELSTTETVYTSSEVFLAFILRTTCPRWNAEFQCSRRPCPPRRLRRHGEAQEEGCCMS